MVSALINLLFLPYPHFCKNSNSRVGFSDANRLSQDKIVFLGISKVRSAALSPIPSLRAFNTTII